MVKNHRARLIKFIGKATTGCSLFFLANLAWAGTVLNVNFTNIDSQSITRAAASPITYTFTLDDGGTPVNGPLNNSFFAVRVYNSADVDVSTLFNTTVNFPGPGNSGTVTVNPKFNTAIAADYYIGLSRNDDGAYEFPEETTKNPGDLADGQFDVTNAPLHIVYQNKTGSTLKQQDGNDVTYNFKIFYPDNNAELSSGGSSLAVKVWNGAVDISSEFTISTPVYNINQWQVDIQALYNTTIQSGYTISVARLTGDTLNTAETYRASASTTPDGNGNTGLGNGTADGQGEFEVQAATPSINYLGRNNDTIQINDGIGTTYEWQILYEDGSTLADNTQVLPAQYNIRVYDSSGAVDVSSDFNVATPTYNAGSQSFSVNIQTITGTPVATGYRIGVEALTTVHGAVIAEEKSTTDLGGVNGVFQVTDANLHVVFNNRSSASLEKANPASSTTYDFQLFYAGLTELTNDAGSLAVTVYNSAAADVTSDFNVSAPTYSAGEWHVTIDSRVSAAVQAGYYIGIAKSAGSTGDTLAEYFSNASTTPDGNGNTGLGGVNGAYAVTGASLAIQYQSRSAAAIERADGTGVTFEWDIVYANLTDFETNDSGYSVIVRDSSNADVTANFNVSAITYNGGTSNWQVTVTAYDTTPVAGGYYIEVSKAPGSESDTLAAYASNAATSGNNSGLGSPAGEFAVTNANLHIVYQARSLAQVEQAGAAGSEFTFRVFYPDGVTEETNDSGYTLVVRDSSNADVTANFNVSALTYSASNWRATVTALQNTAVQTGYYIDITKVAGGEGDLLATYASNAGTTGSNVGLGAGGEVEVIDAALGITYLGRNNAVIERADGVGTDFTYRLFYPDATTEETVDAANQVITVFDSGNSDVTSDFIIGTPTYGAGQWTVNVQASNNAAVATGFYISIAKPAGGTSGETLAAENSTVDLGGVNGVFEVQNGRLFIEYSSISANTVERAPATGITYQWRVFLPGTTTEETDDAGYAVNVYNGASNESASFNISAPTYSGGFWQSTIAPLDTTTVQGGYYISVQKPPGGDGRLDETTSYSNMSTTPDPAGNLGLGSPAGEFAVTNANLDIVFNLRSNAVIQRADGTGTEYRFNVRYGDATTNETDDSGYQVELYNGAVLQETFNTFPSTGTNFSISALANVGGEWRFTINALPTATAATGYFVRVSKTAGGEGDILASYDSNAGTTGNNTGLGSPGGEFEVQNASLAIIYNARSVAQVERFDPASTVDFTYRVVYPDGITEETADSGYNVIVRNAGGTDVTANFTVSPPSYGGGQYTVTLAGQTGVTAPATGYYIEVEKAAGATGDTLAAYASNAGTTGNNVGLGAPGGEIEVTNLGIEFLSRDINQFERSDGLGTNYYYRTFIDNNTAGTEVTTEGADHVVIVRNQANADVTGQFTVAAPVYGAFAGCAPAASCWQLNVQASNNVVPDVGYYIEVAKVLGTSNLISEASNVDLAGANAVFEVQAANLDVTFVGNSTPSFERIDGNGTNYTFRMFYGDGVTQYTNSIVNLTFSIHRVSDDANVTADFTLTPQAYAAGVFTLTAQAHDTPTLTPAGSYYLKVGKTAAAGDLDYVLAGSEADSNAGATPPSNNHVSLGSPAGEFVVQGAMLLVRYTGTSLDTSADPQIPVRTFRRENGTGITFFYQVYYPDGVTRKTNATEAGAPNQFYVYDSSGVDRTADFTIAPPLYNGGANRYELNIQANAAVVDTTFWNDYYIGIARSADSNGDSITSGSGPSGDVLSNIPVGGGPPYTAHEGLGANGSFDVTDLRIVFNNRDQAVIQKADNGVNFNFEVFEEGDDSEYTTTIPAANIRVYDSTDADVTANFVISDALHNTGAPGEFQTNIRALPSATVGTGYYIGIEVNPGTAANVALEVNSNAGLGAGGLGAINGVFEIQNATLTVKYRGDSISSDNIFERQDGTGITYDFDVYYPDGTTRETIGTGYVADVRTQANTAVAGCAVVAGPAYNAAACGGSGCWQAQLTCDNTASPANDYRLRVFKNAGADGGTILTANAKFSDDPVGSSADGGLGAGFQNGAFEVTYATLAANWLSGPAGATFEQSDNTTIDFTFDTFYDDTVTRHTSAADYEIRVYDDTASLVDTFTTFGTTGTNFAISALNNSGGTGNPFSFSLSTLQGTPVRTGANYYYVSVTRAGTADTLAETAYNVAAGRFEVSEASLSLVSNAFSTNSLTRGDTASIVYDYVVQYDNGIDEEQNVDAGQYVVRVLDSTLADVSSDFTITGPTWNAGTSRWNVTIETLATTPVGTGYRLEISKPTGGTSGDTLVAETSNTDLAAGGLFDVTNAPLTVNFTGRANAQHRRAEGAGNETVYSFTLTFPNGMVIDNTNAGTFGLPTPGVNSPTQGDQTANFTITGPTWNTDHWEVTALATPAVPLSNDYTVFVEKAAGDFINPLEEATTDLGTGLTAPAGSFEVQNGVLHILYQNRNNAVIDRADGIGTDYSFRALYQDNTTEESTDATYVIYVMNDGVGACTASICDTFTLPGNPFAGTQNGTYFDLSNFNYSGGQYTFNIEANDSAPAAAGYYIRVEKASGGALEEDTLAAFDSNSDNVADGQGNVGLNNPATNPTNEGEFEVQFENQLNVTFNSKDTESIVRDVATGNGVNYNYTITFDDGTEETNDLDYIIRVYDSGGVMVAEKAGNGTSYSMTAGATDWFISDPAYNAVTKWQVRADALGGAPVDTGYYISVTKMGGADQMNEETSIAGDMADGDFDVTNVVLSGLAISNASMQQNAALGSQSAYTFSVYDTVVSGNGMTSPPINLDNYNISIYDDATDTLQETFTSLSTAQAGTNFDLTAITYSAGSPNTYSFSIKAKESSTTQDYYVTVGYSETGVNVLETYSTKGTANFTVTDANLHIVYNARTVNEFEKADGVGTDYRFNIYYDDNTEVTDITPGNTAYRLVVYDKTDTALETFNNIEAGVGSQTFFHVGQMTYDTTNLYWQVNVQANIAAASDDGYYISIEKLAGANGDTLAQYGSNSSTTADASGNAGLDNPGTPIVNEGAFKVNNATLIIKYRSINTTTVEKADNIGFNIYYNVLYKNGVENQTEPSEYIRQVFDSGNTDASSTFIFSSPFYGPNAGCAPSANCWQLNIKASNATTVGTGYHVRIGRNAGSAGATLLPAFASNQPIDAVPANNSGLDNTGTGAVNEGEFEVTGAQLRIAYNAPVTNTQVQRLENNIDNAAVFQFQVFYRDDTQEFNDTGYNVEIFDSSDAAADSNFDFFNWASCTWDAGAAFNQADHMRYAGSACGSGFAIGNYKIGLRPRVDAAAATGYYIRVSKTAGGEGDLLDPVGYVGLTSPPFNSNSANETTANGVWVGQQTNGQFEVRRANLHIVYAGRSNATVERAAGVGTDFTFNVYYPDLAPATATGPTEEASETRYRIRVRHSSCPGNTCESFTLNNNPEAGPITGGNGLFVLSNFEYTGGQYTVNIDATDLAVVQSGYYIDVRKLNGGAGEEDLLGTYASNAGTSGNNIGLNGTAGEFEVVNASLHVVYNPAQATPSVEQADDIAPTYEFSVFYKNNTTQETNDTGYQVTLKDNSGGTLETFNTFPSTGTNFDISALAYNAAGCGGTGCWSTSIIPRKNAAVAALATGHYISVEKLAGGEGDTLAAYDSINALAADGNGNQGMGDPLGRFEVTNATLNIVYNDRTPAQVEKGDTVSITYRWKMYYDNVATGLNDEETIDATDYSVTIRDRGTGTDRTANFNVPASPTYNGGSGFWEYTFTSQATTPILDDYYIEVAKAAGGGTSLDTFESPDAPYASNQNTTGQNVGLGQGVGAGQGEFEITGATLYVEYQNRANPSMQRLENNAGSATTYNFQVKYPNGTEETDDTGYSVIVRNSGGIDITNQFDFYQWGGSVWQPGAAFNEADHLRYNAGNWQVKFRPRANGTQAVLASDNYIEVSKAAGGEGDTLAAYNSNAGTTGSNTGLGTGLGAGNGEFAVTAANLHIVYAGNSITQFERADGSGTTISFNVYYPDMAPATPTGPSEETSQAGYDLTVRDSSNSDVTANFIVPAAPTYSGGAYSWQISARDSAAVGTGYYVEISKVSGGGAEEDLLTAHASNTDNIPDGNGNAGLNVAATNPANEGEFEITPASLNIAYTNRTPAQVERGDTTGVTYSWRVLFDDNTTEEVNDTGNYTVTVYDKADTAVATFNTATVPATSGAYTLNSFSYSGTAWQAEILALQAAAIDTDYYISVQKTAGAVGEEDTLAEFNSKEADSGLNQSLGTTNGVFEINGSRMRIEYIARNTNVYPAQVQRLENNTASTIEYQFRVLYPDGSQKAAGDGYQLDVLDSGNTSQLAEFDFYNGATFDTTFDATNHFIYQGGSCGTGCWSLTLRPKQNAPLDNGYHIQVSKTAGTDGDTLDPADASLSSPPFKSNSTTSAEFNGSWMGLGTGLANTAGEFEVIAAQLHLVYDNLNPVQIEKATGAQANINFRVLFPDGSEETSDGGYNLVVRDSSNTDVSANFTFAAAPTYGAPVAGAYNWQVSANSTALAATGYYFEISKAAAGALEEDTLAAYNSNTDNTPDGSGNTGLNNPATNPVNEGEFEVLGTTLHIAYNSRTSNAYPAQVGRLEPTQSDAIQFDYKVLYPDLTEETDDTGYVVQVIDSSNTDVTANFDFYNWGSTSFDAGAAFNEADHLQYAGSNFWQVSVRPRDNAALDNGYYIRVSKTVGNEGDNLPAYASNAAPPADAGGNLGLDTGLAAANGEFEVIAAQLNIVYAGKTPASIEKTQSSQTVDYTFNVYYPDGSEETSQSGYVLTVRDSSNTDVTGNFTLASAQPSYSAGRWQWSLYANEDALAQTSYYIELSKASGGAGQEETLATYASNASTTPDGNGNAGLGTGSAVGQGEFDVTGTTLVIEYQARANAQISKLEPNGANGTTYTYLIKYPQTGVEETDDTGYNVIIRDGSNADVTGNFDFWDYTAAAGAGDWDAPAVAFDQSKHLTYTGGAWNVRVRPRDTSTVAVGYYIEVSKAAGNEGDTLAAYNSNAGTAGGNIGLGPGLAANEGDFEVLGAQLHIVYSSLSPVSIGRGSTTGTTITYNVLYPDNTTEETDGVGDYVIRLYTTLAGPPANCPGGLCETFTPANTSDYVGTDFTLRNFNYNGTAWEFELIALQNAIESTGGSYYVAIEKLDTSDGDYLNPEHASNASSTPDAIGNIGLAAAGAFDVSGEQLHIVYIQRTGGPAMVRQSGTGVGYEFRVQYPDLSHEETDKAAYKLHIVGDATTGSTGGTIVDTIEGFTTDVSDATYITGNNSLYEANLVFVAGSPGFWQATIRALKTAPRAAIGGYTDFALKVEKEPDTINPAATKPDTLDLDFPSNVVTSGLNSGLGPAGGQFTIDPAPLSFAYDTQSVERFARADGVGITYEINVTYPDGSIFNDTDLARIQGWNASNQFVAEVRDSGTGNVPCSGGTSVTCSNTFNTTTQRWEFNIQAPYTFTSIGNDFYVEAKIEGSDEISPAAPAFIASNVAAPADGKDGLFDIEKANIRVEYVSIEPKNVNVGEEVEVKVKLYYGAGTTPVTGGPATNGPTSDNLSILRVEDAAQEDTSQFTITAQPDFDPATNIYTFRATPSGSEFSKVGEKVRIRGALPISGDFINVPPEDSVDQLEEDGKFVVTLETVLYQNFPNPFDPNNGKTQIRFNLVGDAASSNPTLKIFTVGGRLVKTFNQSEIINNQRVYWDGRNDSGRVVASGIYYCVLDTSGYRKFIKIAVVK